MTVLKYHPRNVDRMLSEFSSNCSISLHIREEKGFPSKRFSTKGHQDRWGMMIPRSGTVLKRLCKSESTSGDEESTLINGEEVDRDMTAEEVSG